MPVMRELEPAECERLLCRGVFGRVVVGTPHGAEILPVNYAVEGEVIRVRISPTGLLARHAHDAELVFETDLVDHDRWQGWSVVARGVGQVVHDAADAGTGAARVRPWADGDRTSELRLAWTRLTGRVIGGAWDPEAAMYSRKPVR